MPVEVTVLHALVASGAGVAEIHKADGGWTVEPAASIVDRALRWDAPVATLDTYDEAVTVATELAATLDQQGAARYQLREQQERLEREQQQRLADLLTRRRPPRPGGKQQAPPPVSSDRADTDGNGGAR